MYLIIGLGNPGQEYHATRHNMGRDIVEAFGKKMQFPAFRFEKKWNVEITEGNIGKENVALVLPDTFMNKSGAAAGGLSRFYKIKPDHIIVVHDDADFALGAGKLSFAKRSAGHKGVESVIRCLKTRNFWRLRIGIAGRRDIPAEKIVLKKFAPDEKRLVVKITKRAIEALEQAIIQNPEIAMNQYNT